ncbi:MAG: hypothetical protein Q7W05_13520 [Deltaproteobacteria bacterium]|nr:hypothetical protein [Deltaproteobacteria bacterium]
MQNIHYGLIMLLMLMGPVNSAKAQVSIGIGLPNVSIGINLPMFPHLTRVPGYPVYYAPQMDANYFFYDGMYWVYQGDDWYASSWYNGPWSFVEPGAVPLFILRIPVRYYRQPPEHFRGWQSNAPPRWGQHWGYEWEQNRVGWDRWNRRSVPAPAPLPVYQKKFSGSRYPVVEQQQTLRGQNYRYQPKDTTVRQHLNQQAGQKAPAPAQRAKQADPSPKQQATPHSAPLQQGAPADPHSQPPQRGGEFAQKPAPAQTAPQQRAPVVHDQKQPPRGAEHQQQAPAAQDKERKSQDRGASQEPNRGQGQRQDKDEERGRGRDK